MPIDRAMLGAGAEVGLRIYICVDQYMHICLHMRVCVCVCVCQFTCASHAPGSLAGRSDGLAVDHLIQVSIFVHVHAFAFGYVLKRVLLIGTFEKESMF